MTGRTGRFLRSIRAGSLGEQVVMEWMPWPWDHTSDEPDGPAPLDRRQETPRVPSASGAQVSYLDVQLIGVLYGTIAAGSYCEDCGARFARGLRILPPPMEREWPWQLLVVTKCRGWRHHLHAATVVVNEGDDMQLGPLRATD
jgi:hypothetical protein